MMMTVKGYDRGGLGVAMVIGGDKDGFPFPYCSPHREQWQKGTRDKESHISMHFKPFQIH